MKNPIATRCLLNALPILALTLVTSRFTWAKAALKVDDEVKKNYQVTVSSDFRVTIQRDKTLTQTGAESITLKFNSASELEHALKTYDAREQQQELVTATALTHAITYVAKNSTVAVNPNPSPNPSKESQFIDKRTGVPLSTLQAAEQFAAEAPKNRHFLRAFSEISLLIGLGWVGYNYPLAELSLVDHDFKDSFAGQKEKYGNLKGMRFDNNPFIINQGHAFAGLLYYWSARTNGFSTFESLLFSFAGSAMWETLVERQEVFGIGDMITTPMGGMAIGETFYQLGQFFDSASPTLAHRILGAIFGGPEHFHRWLDDRAPNSSKHYDAHGFNSQVWHKLGLDFGVAITKGFSGPNNQFNPFAAHLKASSEIINAPKYAKEGQFSGILSNGEFTKAVLSTNLGEAGLQDFWFFVKTALVGYYHHNATLDEQDRLSGYSYFVGLSSAFDLSMQQSPQGLDQIGAVHVVGSTLDTTFYHKGVKIRAVLDVYGDFAQVHSYAVDKLFNKLGWTDILKDARAKDDPTNYDEATDHGTVLGTKSVLEYDKTYIAYGITAELPVEVEYCGFSAGAKIKAQSYHSINGRDRFQEKIKPGQDFSLSDSKLIAGAWISFPLPIESSEFKFEYEHIWRDGTAKDETVDDERSQFKGTFNLRF